MVPLASPCEARGVSKQTKTPPSISIIMVGFLEL